MPSVSSSHLLRQFITTPRRCSRDSTNVPLRTWSSYASHYSTTSPRPASCVTRSTSAPILRPSGPSSLPSLRVTRRTFVSTSSTRAAIAQRPPSHRTQLVSYPSSSGAREEDEDEDEADVEFVRPEEAVLEMTDRAAEVRAFVNFPITMSRHIFMYWALDVCHTATSFPRNTRSQRCSRVADCSRERRVPRVPVQDGAGKKARARRLVRSHLFSTPSPGR